MDIESKRYRVRTADFGQLEITYKPMLRRVYVPARDLPSLSRLAIMPEREFDRVVREAMGEP